MATVAGMSDQQLNIARRTYKGQITKFKTFVDEFKADSDHLVLESRVKRIEEVFNQFNEVQLQLELTDLDAHSSHRFEVEDVYFDSLGKAKRILNDRAVENASPQSATESRAHIEHPVDRPVDVQIQLPAIDKPRFNGTLEGWPSFSNAFKATIGSHARLRDAQRLAYLLSCVDGSAADKIKQLDITDANYSVAWEILERNYNQPSHVIFQRIRGLVELPRCINTAHDTFDQLIDKATTHYSSLQAMNRPFLEMFPVYLIASKLDKATRIKWNERSANCERPTVQELLDFLHEHRRILATARSKVTLAEPAGAHRIPRDKLRGDGNNRRISEFKRSKEQTFVAQVKSTCGICGGPHNVYSCERVLKASITDRTTLVKTAGLCLNCLRAGHISNDCKAGKCRKCNKAHHTLLHPNPEAPRPHEPTTVISNQAIVRNEQVLLSTAVVYVLDNRGKRHSCRVLLDVGSQSNFITTRLADRLKLPQREVAVNVSGINQVVSQITRSTEVRMNSRLNNYQCSASFLIRDRIADSIPSQRINRDQVKIPSNRKLADPQFYEPRDVDALLGAELFYDLLGSERSRIPGQKAVLQRTQFGWVVTGRISGASDPQTYTCSLSIEPLHESLTRFWELEEGTRVTTRSVEETECENHYASHAVRDNETGRYTVRLPFKSNPAGIGNSYRTALRRLHALERTLDRRPELRSAYTQFMREYKELGHMSQTDKTDTDDGYYLPHHAVLKNTSLTTKLRVVFDASARTTTGQSLNSILMTGPTIQDDLTALIMRFRTHRVALTADISKMYRQICMHVDDRKYQRILWRESTRDPVRTYELNTVTYGTSAAPFLAIRTLHRLADDESDDLPYAAGIFKRDFYVDDLLSGAASIEEARVLRDQLIELARRGGFELRQWASNEPRLVADFADSAEAHLCLNLDDTTKTLGVYWNPRQDQLFYMPIQYTTGPVTKRSILSRVASLFDPLGLIGPVIVTAKLIMQAIWLAGTDWDSAVPPEILADWDGFNQSLINLEHFRLPRALLCEAHTAVELHGFADASERAYGACVYARSTDAVGIHHTALVCSKSRVAPLKTVTLPRLELCAAVLLCKLMRAVTEALRLSINETVYWSDSTITLHWINHPPHRLKTFVANRVAEIQRFSHPRQWRHVRTQDNPADLVSRGASPSELGESDLWRSGPTWLRSPQALWPRFDLTPASNLPETRPPVTSCLTVTSSPPEASELFRRFSSFPRMIRVLSYCIRFSKNAGRTTKDTGPLTPEELQVTKTRILKAIQASAFDSEAGRNPSTPGKPRAEITALSPFRDEDGLIRVGGRLKNANLPYNYRHPILLPRNSHVADLIIRYWHVRSHHAGLQATLGAIRQEYWPLGGRTAVKGIIHKCVTCRRATPTIPIYTMGDLPRHRVTFNRPFLISGIDYCGPLYIKERKHRNRGKEKIFVAIFVCLVTKAVHIELVTDLTSEAFIAALRRFFARRGKSTDLYSDNATTFIGANRELETMYNLLNSDTHNHCIQEHLANEGIRWHFIPPRSPHFGGLWEAAVKSFKNHFRRVIGDSLLTYEAMLTYAIEIEAILNSRPITPLSTDPNDLQPLTPAHFFIGDSIIALPEHDLQHLPTNRLSVWQHVQQMKQHFWTRWHKDYLHELTVRKKWHSSTPTSCEVGTLVLLHEPDIPPMRWKLGRIIAVHPGSDEQIRVATVKTSQGEYKRCIKKLSPLPVDAPNEERV